MDDEIAKFHGSWKVVSKIENGGAYSADRISRQPKLTFNGADYSWSNGMMPGIIVTLDPTKSPKTIDYQSTAGKDKNRTYLAIYKIEGDAFKECFAPAGQARPTEFDSKEGSGYTLVLYKRIK